MGEKEDVKGRDAVRGNGSIGIALGSTCIGIRCDDDGSMGRMRAGYAPFLASRTPDFLIDLRLRRSLSRDEINETLQRLRVFCDGERLVTKPQLIDCRLDRRKGSVSVETESDLFAPDASYKLMNHLLRGSYYAVHRWKRGTSPESYLIHGCGIASGGRGYLFVGPSGIGKTTVATLAQERRVLNDEAVLVGRNGSGLYVAGTPFDGGAQSRCPAVEPLSAVFLLKQDKEVSLRKLSGAEAYRAFLGQVLDAAPLLDTSGVSSFPERADLSAGVAAGVPAYELGFLPDTSFWEAVESI
jgi:hypothetical protein